ncbi:MAG: FtsX-like permease family protein [Solobacterium sp.]|nr:FtsX-like permease family protein [Solobacterium sp.]
MKRVHIIDIIRTIQKRFISFLSICLIVGLGSGGFFLVNYGANGMRIKASEYYKQYRFKDYEIVSSLGVTEEQVERFDENELVEKAEGALAFTGKLNTTNFSTNVRIHSLTDEISIAEVIEGTLPTKANECALGEDIIKQGKIKLGDTVSIRVSTSSEQSPLNDETFKVTAIVRHPEYLRLGMVLFVLLPSDAFNTDVTQGLYTSIYVKTKEEDRPEVFDMDYISRHRDTENALETLADSLSEESVAFYRERAETKINEQWESAQKQFAEAEAKIADAEKQLSEGEQQLASAKNELETTIAQYRQQIADGKVQLEKTAEELMYFESQVRQAETALAEGKQKLNEAGKLFQGWDPNVVLTFVEYAISKLEEAQRIIESKDTGRIHKLKEDIKAFFENEDNLKLIKAAGDYIGVDLIGYIEDVKQLKRIPELIEILYNLKGKIQQYLTALDQMPFNERQLQANKVKLYDAWIAFHAAEDELAEKEALLNQKESEERARLAEAEAEFESKKKEAEEEIAKGKQELADKKKEAEERIASVRSGLNELDCNLIVQNRATSFGYIDQRGTIAAMESTGNLFGVLFALVAALVCFSTLTIIIEEEKKLVGTTKAFGFHDHEIVTKYILFGALSSFIGVLIGVGIGAFFSRMLLNFLGRNPHYAYGTASPFINMKVTLLVAVVFIALCSLVSYGACRNLLRSPASILMKGETLGNVKKQNRKKETKESNSPLYSRLIIRNILNDKPRVLISIIIVAASCMVIGLGISLKLAFDGMLEKQVSEIAIYDGRIEFNRSISEEALQQMEAYFEENQIDYLPAGYELHFYRKGASIDVCTSICADPARINDFFVVADPTTKQPLTLRDDGFYGQIRLAETRNLEVGDTLQLYDNELVFHNATYLGCFDNRQGRYIIVTPKAYEKIFQYPSTTNCYFVNLNGFDEQELIQKMTALSTDFSYERADAFLNRLDSVRVLFNFIVVGMIGIAVIMSFMILTNVTNIYVNRKKKELIVMRINGFSIKQVIMYLVHETVLINIVGLLIALILGFFMTKPIIMIMEQPDTQYVRDYRFMPWLIALVVEAFFALIINWSAFRKIKDLNFREIL